MRQYIRGILVFLTAIALVMLIIVVSLFSQITPAHVQERLTRVFADHFHVQWKPTSPIAIKIFPTLTVTIPTGEFQTDTPELFKATHGPLRIELSPWSVFAHTPRVHQITLTGLDATVPLKQWSELAQTFAPSQSYPIDLVEIHEATVRFSDDPSTLSGLTFEARRQKFGHFILTAQTHLATPELTTQIVFRSHVNWLDDTPLSAMLWQNLNAYLDGQYQGAPLKASLQLQEAQQLLTRAPTLQVLTGEIDTSLGKFHFKMPKIERLEHTWRFPQWDLTGKLRSEQFPFVLHMTSTLETDARYDVTLSDLALTLNQANTNESVGHLLGQLAFNSKTPEGHFQLDGVLEGAPVTINLHLSHPSVEPLPQLRGQIHLTQLPPIEGSWLDNLLPYLGKVQGEVQLNVDNPQSTLRRLTSTLTLDQTGLSTNNVTLELTHSMLQGVWQLAPDGQWKGALQGDDVSLEDLWGQHFIVAKAKTRLDAQGQLTHSDATQWRGEFLLSQGCLLGADVAQLFTTLAQRQPDLPPSELLQSANQSCFNRGRLVVETDKTHLTIPTFSLQADAWHGSFYGSLREERIALKGTLIDEERFTKPVRLAVDVNATRRAPAVWTLNWDDVLFQARSELGEPPLTWERFVYRSQRTLEDLWHAWRDWEWTWPTWNLPQWNWDDLKSSLQEKWENVKRFIGERLSFS